MKKISNYLVLVLVYAGMVVINSCSKQTEFSPENVSCENILYFNDLNELNKELNLISEMSHDELLQWESKKGFNSFGVRAEDFYWSIDFESFKSKDELEKLVQSNNKYLTFIYDDNGEISIEPKLGNDNYPTDDIYEVNYIARPYKRTLGVWYWVASRIINGEINFDLRILDEQGEWAKFMRTNQTFNTIGSKAEGIFDTTMVYDYNAPSPYSYRFEGIKCVAFQHECKNDSAYIKCNEQIFD